MSLDTLTELFNGSEALFTAFFASIPHDSYRNNPVAKFEGYDASVFYAYFASLGLDLTPEESSNAGRLDLVLRFDGQVYLFEFKMVELPLTGGVGAAEGARLRGPLPGRRADSSDRH